MFCVLATPEREQGVDVGALVDQALRHPACGMSHKEAWLICRMDKGQWSRGIHGHGAMDLWHLVRLPWKFWLIFLPSLVREMTRNWLLDFTEERKERAS